MTTPSPPLKWLLAYRLLGLRLPDEYRDWVVEDTKSKSFLTWRGGRTFVWLLALIGLAAFGYRMGFGQWPATRRLLQASALALAIALFSSREQLVRRTLRWHHLDRKGNRVSRPKRFARLRNLEAALLGATVLVAFTGASAVVGYGFRPTGPAAAPCREAEPAVFDRIRAGATGDPNYLTTRMVRYKDLDVVLAVIAPAEKDGQPSIEGWLVRGDKIERLVGEESPPTTTSFPRVSSPVDRIAQSALERAAKCLELKPVR